MLPDYFKLEPIFITICEKSIFWYGMGHTQATNCKVLQTSRSNLISVSLQISSHGHSAWGPSRAYFGATFHICLGIKTWCIQPLAAYIDGPLKHAPEWHVLVYTQNGSLIFHLILIVLPQIFSRKCFTQPKTHF